MEDFMPYADPKKNLNCRRRYKAEAKARAKQHVADYLATRLCVDCGESNPIVLDFDHRNPTEKYRSISQIIAHALGIKVLIKEIEKCDIRCANCHRIRHYKMTHS
jgi:hypothetical protein